MPTPQPSGMAPAALPHDRLLAHRLAGALSPRRQQQRGTAVLLQEGLGGRLAMAMMEEVMRYSEELSHTASVGERIATPPALYGSFSAAVSEDGSAPSMSGEDGATQRAYRLLPPVTGCVPLRSSRHPASSQRHPASSQRHPASP
jgi:hypothetical protein